MGIYLSSVPAIVGGAVGGAAGYTGGRAAEEYIDGCAQHPGMVPKIWGITGCYAGAMTGFVYHKSREGKSENGTEL